jgi:hypothetical protein
VRIKDANLSFTTTGGFTTNVYFTLKRRLTTQSPKIGDVWFSPAALRRKARKSICVIDGFSRMNTFQNPRLTFARRLERVRRSLNMAELWHKLQPITARRHRLHANGSVAISPAGAAALTDASSRPARSPRAIAPATAWRVLALR